VREERDRHRRRDPMRRWPHGGAPRGLIRGGERVGTDALIARVPANEIVIVWRGSRLANYTPRGDGTRGSRAPSALSRHLPSPAEHLSALLPDGRAVMKIQENSGGNLAHSVNPTLAVRLLPLLCAATQL
jgi:hypothetical protein